MSLHFYPLRVAEIRKETADCVSLVFDIPDKWQTVFDYKQGQYLTIRTHIGQEEVRRSYSVCSSPLEKECRIAVKKVSGGLFSTFANEELRVGDTLDVMPPIGKFFVPLNPSHHKQYVAFAAGSGITPVLSILKTTLQTEPNSQFTLIYGNRTRHSMIFREEIEGLKNRYLQRFRFLPVLSRERTDVPLQQGRIDEEKCKEIFKKYLSPETTDVFFLCGPEGMIASVQSSLKEAGVPPARIHTEHFSSPGTAKVADKTFIREESVAKSRVTIKLDGISFDFDLEKNGQSVLDAALQKGADLPYACKGGVCCTCKAKLVQGEVSMDINYGLEPDELEQGFILSCQSHPVSDTVIIDFDQK